MSRFERQFRGAGAAALLPSPVRSVPGASTHGGVPGVHRDAKGELFLLAVSLMVGEDTYYERAAERDDRLRELVRRATAEDPAWVAAFARWLRGSANLRSVAVAVACEYVRAGGPGGRQVVDSVCLRADEPAEVLACWRLRCGRAIPQPVKRGVADAARRLYTERNALKYDGPSRSWRMGDVVELCHVRPSTPEQSQLFRYLIDRRHGRDDSDTSALPTIAMRAVLDGIAPRHRRAMLTSPDFAEVLAGAGMTWEALAGWLGGPMDRDAWLAVLPSMGYLALIRNLRNFDEAGLTDADVAPVLAAIADPVRVRGSRVFPVRLLAAYQQCASDRWRHALSVAADHSLSNLPDLPGRTLVLVDVSDSMRDPLSARSAMSRVDAALLFGVSLALRAPDRTTLRLFDTAVTEVSVPRGGSVLRLADELRDRGGGRTDITGALATYHDGGSYARVVLVTDEQATWGYHDPVPPRVPVHTFNLAGYKAGFLPSGGPCRTVIGGLNDAAFSVVAALEAGRSGRWPWETA